MTDTDTDKDTGTEADNSDGQPVTNTHSDSQAEQTSVYEDISFEEARTFFDESNDVFAVTDLSGKVLKVNAAERRVLGLEKEYPTSESFIDLNHPDDRQKTIDWIISIKGGSTDPLEVRCRTKDGTFKWMEWRAVAFPSDNRLYSIGRDISQRKAAEMKSAQLASIVETSSDAIICVDLNENITSWNRRADILFGHKAVDAEGQPIGQLFGPENLGWFTEPVAIGTERQTTCLCKNGATVSVAMMISHLFDESGKLVGYSVFFRDISERQQMEKRVREFYSTVSHELRTPLTSIRGALGLISGGVVGLDSEDGMEMIKVAKDSADRLIRLINDILDVQKIESGEIQLNRSELAPSTLFQQALNESSGMAESLTVTIRGQAEVGLPTIMADGDKVVQVLTNLISNAIKFSPDGETVDVTVKLNDLNVRFSVTDRGPGIPLEESHRLFEKFQQLHSPDTRNQSGTGLGLAICKSLVEQHSGTIGYFNNASGPGCTFWFELLHNAERSVDS